MNVQLLDLKKQYETIKPEVIAAINNVLESQRFIMGPEGQGLEKEIQEFCEVKHAIGVSSGTDALLISLMALDIKPKNIVLTTPYTFFATGGVIARLGAIPCFVDIDPLTYNMDLNKLEDKLAALHPKVVIPVHLYGQMVDMHGLLQLQKKYEFKIVEDAAQAIGAQQTNGDGKEWYAGTIGDLGCYSFFPSKNLGGYGDGGMIVTNDDKLAERVRRLRIHGAKDKYNSIEVGINGRLDEIQAAVLRVKLKYLEQWSYRRYQNAEFYELDFILKNKFYNMYITLPYIFPSNTHIYHQYVIRAQRRDELKKFLNSNDIGCEVYYPIPLHLQECFKYLGWKEGDFPEAEKAAKETLALPIFPELEDEQIIYVVDKILEFYREK